jgi:predicted Zn-dependent peptidase
MLAAFMPSTAPEPTAETATLPNGVRVVALPQPGLRTASVSIFVGCGSLHEDRAFNGISHFVEHMVFKGTAQRDVQRINADAEALGAEVNAHTDKDHTAFHISGLAEHAPRFVHLLSDLVSCPSFPEDELERERQVLLDEHAEEEDDAVAAAFRQFDSACWGVHPMGQAVIGQRRTTERLQRADLQAWVDRHYRGANVVVAAAGGLDVDALLRQAQTDLGALAPGQRSEVAPPAWQGGLHSRAQPGSGQTHLVLGFPVAPLGQDEGLAELAAAVLGEGMSSPLLAELREKRGLVYYANCSADQRLAGGEFVLEASCAPARVGAVLEEMARLLVLQAQGVQPGDLLRAVRQVQVRHWRALERPARQAEGAALDLLALGRLRPHAQRLARLQDFSVAQLQAFFAHLLQQPVALALGGAVPRGTRQRCTELLARHGLRTRA